MCVFAAGATGLFGLGAGASNLFLASLGLTAATGLAQRSAAQAAAKQTYQSALIANQSAEDAKRLQQEALAEQKSETEKASAQDIFAKNIQSLIASSKIVASERAGTTVGLLLQDQERQAANYRESINQTLESARRQYTRNIAGTEAQFLGRRNQLQSNINQAYNQIPSLGSVLLNTAVQGLSTYAGLTGGLGGVNPTGVGPQASYLTTGSPLYIG
tara:strand:+ start:37 stop:684 length:648 start_codon:yes stop_codon:yes gene_type:complete